MLVIHRASEPPKLTVRAPAPAHRVWVVRSIVALLVALLVVSNAALGAGRWDVIQRLIKPWQHKHPKPLVEKPSGLTNQHPQLLVDEPPRGWLELAVSKLSWEEYAKRKPPRLEDGRFALPNLNKLESALPSQQVYNLTKEILQQHPVELLERGADGRFQSIPKFETTSSDANIFSELRKRHTTAMNDVLATAVYKKISALQSLESPTKSGIGKLKLSGTELKQSLLDLPMGEKSVETPSVAEKAGLTGTKLSEVSSIDVHGDSPNTLLDVKLKPQNNQVEEYSGRVRLDDMIDTINTAMSPFLNAQP